MHFLSHMGRGGFALAVLVATPSLATPADDLARIPLSPSEAVVAALANHADVRQAEADLLLAQGQRRQAAILLANPEADGSMVLDGSRVEVGVAQPLSLTGEGWHARKAASKSKDAAEASLLRTRLEVAAEARTAYAQAVVATARLALAEEGVELAQRLHDAVTRQEEAGEASLLDQRLAHLAQAQAATSLLEALEDEAEALRALASIVARPIDSESLGANPLAAAPEPGDTGPNMRSDVVAAQAELESARAELTRQRSAALPPVGVGAFVEIEDGQSALGPAVSVELPLFNRNQEGRAEAKGRRSLAEAHLASVEARATTEVSTARGRHARAAELSTALGDGLLVEARAALSSVQAGYLAGEFDLATTVFLQSEILDGQGALIGFSGRVVETRVDLLLALEDPRLLAGGEQ